MKPQHVKRFGKGCVRMRSHGIADWKLGDKVTWSQTSEWDENVPRQARGIIEKSPFGGLWVQDIDTNDCYELEHFSLEKRDA